MATNQDGVNKMSLRTSAEMMQNGFVVFPFPSELAKAMKMHICSFMNIPPSSESENETLKRLTQQALSYTDDQFVQKFAKPFRIFPESVAQLTVEWVSNLVHELQGEQTGVNYVCLDEREKNTALKQDSYDIFWRCVRPGKPDVGAAHCDYQFWEIDKGTSRAGLIPFDYNERWKVWIPLMGCDGTNSLQVLTGSHQQEVPMDRVLTKNGYRPMIQPSWIEKYENFFACPLMSFERKCVLFHDKLIHRGPPNNTPHLRLSGELTILLKL